ncbi:formyl transferase [Flavobacteriaceae bacterium D16]|nr:formyl transferase [Flavobacteriaceae bacterium D16]
MRIFFIGTVEFSKRTLNKIVDLKGNIVGVATKSKSGFNADFSDLTPICEANGIPFKYVKDINAPHIIDWIQTLQPDIIFCFGWSSLLKKDLLTLAPKGVIGYHPAALPSNRGRHPIIWALVLGLQETASTFFFMGEGADDGDILSQEKVEISKADDASSLYEKLTTSALNQIAVFLDQLASDTYMRLQQDHSKANSWRKRSRKDGEIDFRMSSQAIYNLVRGLTRPYVGAHIDKEEEEIKVWKVEIGKTYNTNIEPGKVLNVKNNQIEVKTGDGSIWLVEHEFTILPDVNEYF